MTRLEFTSTTLPYQLVLKLSNMFLGYSLFLQLSSRGRVVKATD